MEKRVLLLLLSGAICLSLSACTTETAKTSEIVPPSPTITSSLSAADIEATISEAVGDSIPYTSLSAMQSDNGKFRITLSILDSSEITHMASYIDVFLTTCQEKIDEYILGTLVLQQCYEDGRIMVEFSTVSGGFGKLIDWRSGDAIAKSITDLDELMELFPASKIEQQAEDTLSEEDLATYNEVMAILNRRFNEPEDKIFEDICSDYGMTAAELKAFMRETMGKIY